MTVGKEESAVIMLLDFGYRESTTVDVFAHGVHMDSVSEVRKPLDVWVRVILNLVEELRVDKIYLDAADGPAIRERLIRALAPEHDHVRVHTRKYRRLAKKDLR